MPKGVIFVTGATGMVGRVVVQRALADDYHVRALVRRPKQAADLEAAGAEILPGDLAEPESLPSLAGVDYVVHSAAHVGDWGPAEEYRAINVVALEHLLTKAMHDTQLRRWIQISSLGIYAARDHFGTDESEPPDLAGLDGYTRTKAEAEIVVRRYMEQHALPAVILRPGFIYGEGDRHLLPQITQRLKSGKMRLLGDGMKLLNNTYVGNLVDAVMLALENEAALGETYNIRDERLVTRVEFVGAVADYVGCPHPRHVPLGVARAATGIVERIARWRGRKTAPLLTKARLKFLTLNLDFSIDKAKQQLGYQPAVDFRDGIQTALDAATQRQATA